MNRIDDECAADNLPEEVVSLTPERSKRLAGIATYNQRSAIRDEELRDAVTYDVVLYRANQHFYQEVFSIMFTLDHINSKH